MSIYRAEPFCYNLLLFKKKKKNSVGLGIKEMERFQILNTLMASELKIRYSFHLEPI